MSDPSLALRVDAEKPPPQDGKLRIIAFGAHPDDCELKAGGVAAKWAARGHHVKFVSVTNGDIGHWKMAGGPLAKRRTEEVRKAARILKIHTQVLDIHDGELEPTLENCKSFVVVGWVLTQLGSAATPEKLGQDTAYTLTTTPRGGRRAARTAFPCGAWERVRLQVCLVREV